MVHRSGNLLVKNFFARGGDQLRTMMWSGREAVLDQMRGLFVSQAVPLAKRSKLGRLHAQKASSLPSDLRIEQSRKKPTTQHTSHWTRFGFPGREVA